MPMAEDPPTISATLSGFDVVFDTVSETSRGLMGYWRSLAGPGRLPRKSDLDPAAIVPLLPHVTLLEHLGPDHFGIRLIGTAIVDRIGFDPTGRNIADFVIYDHPHRIVDQLNRIVDLPCGHSLLAHDAYPSGRRMTVDVCRLPMVDATGAPRFIVAVARNRPANDLRFVSSEPQVRAEIERSVFFHLP